MTTATRSRKPPTRKAHVTTIGDAVILWLTVGTTTTAYRVLPLDSQMGGAAFRLEKADQGVGEPESYEVLLDGERSLCCCKGFERFGMSAAGHTGCKHIAGLNAARAAGKL